MQGVRIQNVGSSGFLHILLYKINKYICINIKVIKRAREEEQSDKGGRLWKTL